MIYSPPPQTPGMKSSQVLMLTGTPELDGLARSLADGELFNILWVSLWIFLIFEDPNAHPRISQVCNNQNMSVVT